MKPTLLVIILALFVTIGQAQNSKVTGRAKSSLPSTINSKVKINQNQPSVFITFEKFGKRKPFGDDESEDKVFLRLHNNTRWSINFCIFNLFDKNGNETTYKNAVELGINYEVEKISKGILGAEEGSKTKTSKDNTLLIPRGMPTIHGCSLTELSSGESALFNVEKRELAENLQIKIKFNFGWDNGIANSPSHYVYFSSLSIPK